MNIKGSAKKWANAVLGSIDYDFTFTIDSSKPETVLSGRHGGYRSYEVKGNIYQ